MCAGDGFRGWNDEDKAKRFRKALDSSNRWWYQQKKKSLPCCTFQDMRCAGGLGTRERVVVGERSDCVGILRLMPSGFCDSVLLFQLYQPAAPHASHRRILEPLLFLGRPKWSEEYKWGTMSFALRMNAKLVRIHRLKSTPLTETCTDVIIPRASWFTRHFHFSSLWPNKSPDNVVSAFIFIMVTSSVHHLPSLEYATVEPTSFSVYDKVCLFSVQLAFQLSLSPPPYMSHVGRCHWPSFLYSLLYSKRTSTSPILSFLFSLQVFRAWSEIITLCTPAIALVGSSLLLPSSQVPNECWIHYLCMIFLQD